METVKKKERVFENLFSMVHQPLIVNAQSKDQLKGQKKSFPTIFSALNNTENRHCVIKVCRGLYNERLLIKKKDIKIQAAQLNENSILINQQFPNIIVELQNAEDKVSFEFLKIANICQNQDKHQICNPDPVSLKKHDFYGFQVGESMNTCLYIKKGTVQLDECKISQASFHSKQSVTPCIVVQQQGTLVMNRSEVRGGGGTIGIVCKKGKVIIKESVIKDHGNIGVLAIGNKPTNFVIKNSTIQNCSQGIVLSGPFGGLLQSNNISQCDQAGISTYRGNKTKIIDNQIKQCNTGIHIKNSLPLIIKNTVAQNKQWGLHSKSSNNYICQPTIKFNIINENSKGGMLIEGTLNTTELKQNQFNFNNKYGVKIQGRSFPHVFMNRIIKTLGDGVYVAGNSKVFLQKNQINGSLKCNLVLEGPNNIQTFIYGNKILNARGEGIFTIYGQKFSIKSNQISHNYNGIVSLTGVQNIETNIISQNLRNGILLIQDNNVMITENEIKENKKAGIFIRNTSIGKIQGNFFHKNTSEIVIQKDEQVFNDIEQKNKFVGAYDIRIPKNYSCQMI